MSDDDIEKWLDDMERKISPAFERFFAENVSQPANQDPPGPGRHIFTKEGWIPIPEGMEGTPIQEAWPNTRIPEDLKDAKIYEIEGRHYVVRPGEDA